MIKELKTGPWLLTDLKDIPKNGFNVFSCFHCGGGSTMGYKLAGYNVLGGVEIDPVMMEVYRKNHKPKHSFLMGVQEFNKLPNDTIPKELFNLDILDGSPPCSVFSLAGKREKKWGEEHHFREGQAKQKLDDLFFHFIETSSKLRPKIVVAENVKGLILGNARGYVKEIFAGFRKAGYEPQLFLLNASTMGVPQRRERTFFIARRNDINFPKLSLQFDEPAISVCDAFYGLEKQTAGGLSKETERLWHMIKPGDSIAKVHPRGSCFNNFRLPWNRPANTLVSESVVYHPLEPRKLSDKELLRLQTFPDDYEFVMAHAKYICGMSVPPRMMERIAMQIEAQWLSK